MREIRFRAWDRKEKLWCGGFSIHKSGLFSDLVNGKIENGICMADMHWQKIPEENPNIIIMQFTGLKDKNGKGIYEGDIILLNNVRKSEIIYHTGDICGFQFGSLMSVRFCKETLEFCDIEVIGNIYENPELLTHSL